MGGKIHEKATEYFIGRDDAFGDPIVESWPTEVGTYTVNFIKTITVDGAGDTEYTFLALEELYLSSALKEFDPLTLVFLGLDSRESMITMQSISTPAWKWSAIT